MTEAVLFSYVANAAIIDPETLQERVDTPLLREAEKRYPGRTFCVEWRPHDHLGLVHIDAKRVVLLV